MTCGISRPAAIASLTVFSALRVQYVSVAHDAGIYSSHLFEHGGVDHFFSPVFGNEANCASLFPMSLVHLL